MGEIVRHFSPNCSPWCFPMFQICVKGMKMPPFTPIWEKKLQLGKSIKNYNLHIHTHTEQRVFGDGDKVGCTLSEQHNNSRYCYQLQNGNYSFCRKYYMKNSSSSVPKWWCVWNCQRKEAYLRLHAIVASWAVGTFTVGPFKSWLTNAAPITVAPQRLRAHRVAVAGCQRKRNTRLRGTLQTRLAYNIGQAAPLWAEMAEAVFHQWVRHGGAAAWCFKWGAGGEGGCRTEFKCTHLLPP